MPTVHRHEVLSLSFLSLLAGPAALAQDISELYCDALPNSTGRPSIVGALGSRDVLQNNVVLECRSLPPGSVGYFLVALDRGATLVPGANGPLCLGGGVGRYSAAPLQAGSAGAVSLPIDLTRVPAPMGPTSVAAGSCLHFQYWHRDSASPSGALSAFSAATSIVFQPGPRFALPMLDALFRCEDVAAGDVDGDGDVDLVSASLFNQVAVHENLGEGRFAALQAHDTGGRTNGVELADLDGDGDLDIVVANSLDLSVAVLWNEGAAPFTTRTEIPTLNWVDRAFPADLDGDGDIDLAVSERGPSSPVAIFLNDGSGGFAAPLPLPWNAGLIALEDLDGDGDVDLIGKALDSIDARFNDGQAGFAASSVTLIPGANWGDFGDVDGDGDRDFVALDTAPNRAQVWRRTAGGGYVAEPPVLLPPEPAPAPFTLALPDSDGDGDIDLIVVTGSGAATAHVCENDGTGTFDVVDVVPLGVINGGLDARARAADLDNDGTDDVIVPNRNSETLSLVYGAGAPSETQIFEGTDAQRIGAADLDLDGHMDLVVACHSQGVLGLFFGASDGTFPRLDRLVTASGACSASFEVGDFDGDGAPDIAVGGEANGLELWRNIGQGRFAQVATVVGWSLFGTHQVGLDQRLVARRALRDFDGDGDVDVLLEREVVANPAQGVLLNNGGGTFAAPAQLSGPGTFREAGDMDGDGDVDFVSEEGVHVNLGGLSFALLPASLPGHQHAADIDDDGDLDVITASAFTGVSLQTRLNLGGGVLGSARDYPVAAGGRFTVTGDFDGDGDADVLVERRERGVFSLLFALGGGELGLSESYQAPAALGMLDVVLADFNGNGRADVVFMVREGALHRVVLRMQ